MELSEMHLGLSHEFGQAPEFGQDAHAISSHPAHLTPTEKKVLTGVRAGLLNKQIAYELGIAEATVKAHMTALMRKLNVRNRTQAAMIAVW